MRRSKAEPSAVWSETIILWSSAMPQGCQNIKPLPPDSHLHVLYGAAGTEPGVILNHSQSAENLRTHIDNDDLLPWLLPIPLNETTMVLPDHMYQRGRDSSYFFPRPPLSAKFAAGIARCSSPQLTATFKYPKIPRQKRRVPLPTLQPPGRVQHVQIDLSNTGDERQRDFDRVHEGIIDRSARNCEAWFSYPWLTCEFNGLASRSLGWKEFERPYKMGYVAAVLEEGGRDALGDRLVRVLPGVVRVGRAKKKVVVIESESESEEGD